MSTDRSLWVEDKYATRCRGCQRTFGILRRRHHCRQCGQVFCFSCLYRLAAPPPLLPDGKAMPQVLVGLLSEKICCRCAQLLVDRLTVFTANEDAAARASGSVNTELGRSAAAAKLSCSIQRPRSQGPPPLTGGADSSSGGRSRDEGPSTDSVPGAPAPHAEDAELLRLAESKDERYIAYTVESAAFYHKQARLRRDGVALWADRVLKRGLSKHVEGTTLKHVSAPRASQGSSECDKRSAAVRDTRAIVPADMVAAALSDKSFLALSNGQQLLSRWAVAVRALWEPESASVRNGGGGERGLAQIRAPQLRSVLTASVAAVYSTQVAWGGSIREHFDCLSFPAGPDASSSADDFQLFFVLGVAVVCRLTSKQVPVSAVTGNPRILLLGGEVTTENDSEAGRLGAQRNFTEYFNAYRGQLDKLYQRIKIWAPQVVVVEKGMHHYLQKKITADGGILLLLNAGRESLLRLASGCRATVVRDLQYVGLAELQEPSRSPLGSCGRVELRTAANGSTLCQFLELPAPWYSAVIVSGGEAAGSEAGVTARVRRSVELLEQAVSLFRLSVAGAQVDSPASNACVDGERAALDLELSVAAAMACGSSSQDTDHDLHELALWTSHACRGLSVQELSLVKTATDAPVAGDGSAVVSAPCTSAPIQKPPYASHSRLVQMGGDGDMTILSFLAALLESSGDTSTSASCLSACGCCPRIAYTHGHRRVIVSVATKDPEVESDTADFLPMDVAAFKEASAYFHRQRRSGEARDSAVFRVMGLTVGWRCRICGANVDELDAKSMCDLRTLRLSIGTLLTAMLHDTWFPSPRCACHEPVQSRLSLRVALTFSQHPPFLGYGQVDTGLTTLRSARRLIVEIASAPITVYDLRMSTFRGSMRNEAERETHGPLDGMDSVAELTRDLALLQTTVTECLASWDALAPRSDSDVVNAKDEKKSDNPATESARLHQDGWDRLNDLKMSALARMKEAEMVLTAREADSFRWRKLRPLFNSFCHLCQQHRLRNCFKAPGFQADRSAARWLYSAADNDSVRMSEPTSFLALVVRRMHEDDTFSNISDASEIAPELCGPATPQSPAVPVHPLLNGASPERVTSDAFHPYATSRLFGWHDDVARLLHTASAVRVSSRPPSITEPSTTKYFLRDLADGSGKTVCHVSVEVQFPECFGALQRLYTNGDIAALASSLRRCSPYHPQGGKTNSSFFITHDQRYLLKRIKPQELQHFSAWASKYFSYEGQLYEKQQKEAEAGGLCSGTSRTSSLLARMLGLFTMQIHPSEHAMPVSAQATSMARSPADENYYDSSLAESGSPLKDPRGEQRTSGVFGPLPKSMKLSTSAPSVVGSDGEVIHYVLMESTAANFCVQPDAVTVDMLSSGHVPTVAPCVAFDLKGSQRNRTAPDASLVKLDTDFTEQALSQGTFLFCSPAKKSTLMDALRADTQLLCDAGVMDYSLFATCERAGPGAATELGGTTGHVPLPLRISIIDYLHPFTGVKLLESRVKSSLDAVLGYSGRDPTIVDPLAYMERFTRWMNWYFSEVPECVFSSAVNEGSSPQSSCE